MASQAAHLCVRVNQWLGGPRHLIGAAACSPHTKEGAAVHDPHSATSLAARGTHTMHIGIMAINIILTTNGINKPHQ